MELKTTKIDNIVIGSTINKSSKFSIDVNNFQHITRLLSKGLYSNPIKTLMIEYVQNAIDTHTNINSDKAVVVTLPTPDYLWYEVKDFGEGMSEDFVLNKLTQYGTSTKTKTNTQAGGFGIGFKASAIYCDNFSMYVNYNGKHYEYDVTNHEGSGSITLLDIQPTNEHNGTTIRIPVNAVDCNKFREEFNNGIYKKLIATGKVLVRTNTGSINSNSVMDSYYITISDELEYDFKCGYYTAAINLYSNNIFISKLDWYNFKNKINTILNNSSMLYYDEEEIKWIGDNMYIINDIIDKRIPLMMDVNIPVGMFELNINRESYIWTDELYIYLHRKLIEIIKYQQNLQQEEFKNISTESQLSDILKYINNIVLDDNKETKSSINTFINNICKNAYNKLTNERTTCEIDYFSCHTKSLHLTIIEDLIKKHSYNSDTNVSKYGENLRRLRYKIVNFEEKIIEDCSGILPLKFLLSTDSIIITRNNCISRMSKLKPSVMNCKQYGDNCIIMYLKDLGYTNSIDDLEMEFKWLSILFPDIHIIFDINKRAEKKIEIDTTKTQLLGSGIRCSGIGVVEYNVSSGIPAYLTQLNTVVAKCKRNTIYKDLEIIRLPKNVEYTPAAIIEYANNILDTLFKNRLTFNIYRIFSTCIFIPYDFNTSLKTESFDEKINKELSLNEYKDNIDDVLDIQYICNCVNYSIESKLIRDISKRTLFFNILKIFGLINTIDEYTPKFDTLINVASNLSHYASISTTPPPTDVYNQIKQMNNILQLFDLYIIMQKSNDQILKILKYVKELNENS